MSVTVTILGCGSSGGVPRIGGYWGNCDPKNPKNRRQRCSLLVQRQNKNGDSTNVLIDTSPDLRNQLLAAGVGRIDGVLYTHPHADHIHGIDDLRVAAINENKRVDVWADEHTAEMLQTRFFYCFHTPPGSDYPPILNLHLLDVGKPVSVDGPGGEIELTAFSVHHGRIDALGFRIGGVAYTPDISGIPDETLPALENLDCWIIDSLRHKSHPSHFTLDEALQWVHRMNSKTAILTNMHIDLDYQTLADETPENISPAYDGRRVKVKMA